MIFSLKLYKLWHNSFSQHWRKNFHWSNIIYFWTGIISSAGIFLEGRFNLKEDSVFPSQVMIDARVDTFVDSFFSWITLETNWIHVLSTINIEFSFTDLADLQQNLGPFPKEGFLMVLKIHSLLSLGLLVWCVLNFNLALGCSKFKLPIQWNDDLF